ncbi:MAG: phage major capsid protein [Candidatus Brocadiales bacterium]|nr:phage major capsid protein [Candidatus Bathyanammoxibius amoris]
MNKEVTQRVNVLEKMLKGMPGELEKHKESLADRIEGMVKNRLNDAVHKMVRSPRKLEFPSKWAGSGEPSRFSFGRLFKAMSTKDWTGARYERKALGEGTGSAGGFLVPEEHVSEVKDRITAQAVIRRAGATVYPMATDTLNIPKISGGAMAYWIGENAQITSSDQTVAQSQLVAKVLAAMVKVSNQLLQDSSGAAEAAVRRDIAKVLALAEDIAFIAGDGTSNQPLGIMNTSNVNEVTLGANGGTPDFDDIYDALYKVELNNGAASAWLMHPRTKNTLRKIKDSNGQYIYNVSPSLKEPDSLMGIPVHLTTQIPTNLTVGSSSDCSYILCGQFDEAIIGERLGMEFAVDQSGTAFEYYQSWIRTISRLDFILRTPEVFCKVTGVRP